MIHVERLTKYYGDYPAVRDVSFDVPQGQVVGFLGPNGAGKSTTMRILAGYLTATSGSATIDGIDVFWNPVGARSKIGYLPESCPLYGEMRVEEYLHYRAGVKGVHGSRRRKRLEHVMKRCWVWDVRRQLVGTLSKGYRQRVGLADALVADPPVLILDEPTAGLDPAQIRETRQLIRELGREHTILLSTHILPEVEMTCERVIIIARGRLAAQGTLAELTEQAGRESVLDAVFAGGIDPTPLQDIEGVTGLESERSADATNVQVFTQSAENVSPRLAALAVERGWPLRELRPRRQTLEELFVRVTADETPAAPVAPEVRKAAKAVKSKPKRPASGTSWP
jgi:ABC-2 type transport system ATP-binding protein